MLHEVRNGERGDQQSSRIRLAKRAKCDALHHQCEAHRGHDGSAQTDPYGLSVECVDGEGRRRDQFPVSEVDEVHDAENQSDAECGQRIDRPQIDGIDGRLNEVHVTAPK